MSDCVIITAIICATILSIYWIDSRKGNKKGGDKRDKHDRAQ